MARLPNAQDVRVVRLRPRGAVPLDASAYAASGNAIRRGGREISEFALQLDRRAEQDAIAEAQEADALWRTATREALYDPDRGYLTTTAGRAAYARHDEALEGVKKLRDEFGAGLSEEARRRYDTITERGYAGIIQTLGAHSDRERDAWRKSQYAGQIAQYASDIAASGYSDEAYREGAAFIAGARRSMGEIDGKSSEEIEALVKADKSAVLFDTITARVGVDLDGAAGLFETFGDDLLPDDHRRAGATIQKAREGEQVRRVLGQALGSGGPAVDIAAARTAAKSSVGYERPGEAFAYLVGAGIPDHIAAGIVGNLMVESFDRLDTEALGDNGASYGIAQWQGPRRMALESFAAERGVPASDFETQLAFILHELQTTESSAWAAIQEAKTPAEAAEIFVEKYERAGIPHTDRRIAKADEVFRAMQGLPESGSPAPPTIERAMSVIAAEEAAGRLAPAAAEDARAEVRRRMADAEKIEAERRRTALDQAYELIREGTPVASLPPDLKVELGDDIKKAQDYYGVAWLGREVDTDPYVYTELIQLQARDPAAFASIDLRDYFGALSPSDREELVKLQVRTGETAASGAGPKIDISRSMGVVRPVLEALGVDKPTSGSSKGDWQTWAKAEAIILGFEQRFLDEHNREPTEPELRQFAQGAFAREIGKRETLFGIDALWPDSEAPLVELEIDDIPEDLIPTLREEMAQSGITDPTDDQLLELYLVKVAIGEI